MAESISRISTAANREQAQSETEAGVLRRSQRRAWGGRLLFFSSLLALWWGLAASGVWSASLLPSPAAVAASLAEIGASGLLLPAIATSAQRMMIGYVISLAVGTMLGLALAQVRAVDETLGPVVTGLQSLPSISWLPPALLWFGAGEAAVLFVIVMGAVWSIAQAVRSGVRSLPPLTLRAAQMLGAHGPRLWWHVLLPATLPTFLTGMRLGWAFAWRALMAGELLSRSLRPGVGRLLSQGRDTQDMAMMLAVIVVILAFGLAVDRLLFLPLERVVARRWGVEGA